MRTSKRDLENAFKRAAEAKGWDTGTIWSKDENGNYRSKIGVVFLEHNSVYGWSVGQIVNESGAERRLCDSCKASEMLAWLRGAAWRA